MRKHETQCRSESCVFSFSNPILYTALHKCVLSTLQQCLLQLAMIIIIVIIIIIIIIIIIFKIIFFFNTHTMHMSP